MNQLCLQICDFFIIEAYRNATQTKSHKKEIFSVRFTFWN